MIPGLDVLPLAPATVPLLRPNLPSPALLQQRLWEVQTELAGEGSVSLSGNGGDQVFFSRLERPVQLHDRFVQAPWSRQRLNDFVAYTRLEGFTIWQLGALIARAELARHGLAAQDAGYIHLRPRWLIRMNALRQRAWAGGSTRLPLGRRRQLSEVRKVIALLDRGARSGWRQAVAYPLLTAQLVQAALATPLCDLIDPWCDRKSLRRSMAAHLPTSVVASSWKGDYTGMWQLGLKRHHRAAEQLLLDGGLVAEGFVDVDLARTALKAAALGRVESLWPLLHALAIEAWLDAWALS